RDRKHRDDEQQKAGKVLRPPRIVVARWWIERAHHSGTCCQSEADYDDRPREDLVATVLHSRCLPRYVHCHSIVPPSPLRSNVRWLGCIVRTAAPRSSNASASRSS